MTLRLEALDAGDTQLGLILEPENAAAAATAAPEESTEILSDSPAAAELNVLAPIERFLDEISSEGLTLRLIGDLTAAMGTLARPGAPPLCLIVAGEAISPAVLTSLRLLVRLLDPGRTPSEAGRRPGAQALELVFPDTWAPCHSPAMLRLYEDMRPLVTTDLPVLIEGETGAGDRSWRSTAPRFRPICWRRCSASATGWRPGCAVAPAASSRPPAVPSSSTRSATCRPRSRPSCCGRCRKRRSTRWDGPLFGACSFHPGSGGPGTGSDRGSVAPNRGQSGQGGGASGDLAPSIAPQDGAFPDGLSAARLGQDSGSGRRPQADTVSGSRQANAGLSAKARKS